MKSGLKDIYSFLTDFKGALESGDPSQIIKYYKFPFLFISDQSKNMYTKSSDLVELFQQMVNQYKSYNVGKMDYEVISYKRVTDQIFIIEVKWDYMYPNGEKIFDCTYDYILHRDLNTPLKITSLISIDEHIKLQKLISGIGFLTN